MAINRTSPKKGKVVDIPDATITIGTPTAGAGQVSVAFTVATTPATGGPVQGYTAISNPGSITANASASPVVVTGLTNGTAYTFQVAARNATGRGPLSAASASATPVDPASFESIATVTVGAGGSSSISFSSIPSTYKHLQIRAIASGAGAQRYGVQFNGDTGANYTQHFLYGTGSVAGAGGTTGGAKYNTIGASDGGTAFGVSVTDILDYTNTNKNTVVRSLAGYDTNTSNGLAVLYSFVWLNTAAVTSLTIQAAESYSGNFAQYSQFALYGIKG